jgi:hypothetical protein
MSKSKCQYWRLEHSEFGSAFKESLMKS